MTEKYCAKCGETKPTEDFNRNAATRSGLQAYCRSCHAEMRRSWRERNRDKERGYNRDWHDRHREETHERNRKWRAENADYNRERSRRWSQENPEKARDLCARRRARIAGAPEIEKIDRIAIYDRDGGRCHICGKQVTGSFHLDHLVPLSKGGSHVAANLRVAHPRCNQSRGDGRLPAQLLLA